MTSNMPKGDVWEFIDNDSNSLDHGKKFKFDFSFMESEKIRNVLKQYILNNYKQKNKSTGALYKELKGFMIFNNFLIESNIKSLDELNNNDIEKFMSYFNTIVSKNTNKPFSLRTKRVYLSNIKSIISWGQLYMPSEVPKLEIFIGNEYIGVNKKLKIDFIPDDILSQINKSLKNEPNPYIKYGIIILQSTGMRLGDMLKLTTDCIKPHLISGYTLTWYDHKNRKERQPMSIPNECAIAVEKLIEYTTELRKQISDDVKNYIFIHKPTSSQKKDVVTFVSNTSIRNWIENFISNNNIKDTNGELYNLTAHQFRRTLATDMLSKGTDLKAIQEVLGHTSPLTTRQHYADIKDKERAEVFKNIGIIGNINKVDETVIENKQDLIWFKENKDKGARMEDGYCTKPCSDGKICDRLLKKQKCYTCGRYITTTEYLQAHKNHLKELEKQLEGNIYGDHYAEHFIPTIEILKEIVRRLEEIQDGNTKVAITSDN